jgi:hypothetical protein
MANEQIASGKSGKRPGARIARDLLGLDLLFLFSCAAVFST